MDEEIAKNKRELEEMQKSWEQKVKDLEAQQKAERVRMANSNITQYYKKKD